VAAKYFGRGIFMHLGMDVTVGVGGGNNVVRNLCTVMAGAEAAKLPVEIQTTLTNTVSYTFSLPNGDRLVALWANGVAAEYDAGVTATLTFPDLSDAEVRGIDVLYGFEQQVVTSEQDGNLVIRSLLVKDYPIVLRLGATRRVFLPLVLKGPPD
jgi:hypothetical protein